ncbi:MAG: hypothetical protein JW891_02440 [Candidatus Lokiarchaeota archaeon]|nr:hypothetical protein [Candidatus Lokiarchaeota archaeon]
MIEDGNGGAFILWEDTRNGITNIDLYIQRIDQNGEALWENNGTIVSNEMQYQQRASLISDGDDGIIVVWQDNRDGSDEDDIYAQKFNASGNPQWELNGTIVCNSPDVQGSLEMISDGVGGVIVVWQDERDDSGDIYTQRINDNGVPQWNDNGTVICNYTGTQSNPKIISDGAQGAIIVWVDGRVGTDIYAQKVDANGISQWTLNGIVVCNQTASELYPEIVSDDNGGAFVAWVQPKPGSRNRDLYIQRIDTNSVRQWGSEGKIVSNTDGDHFFHQITADAIEGVIVSWCDSTNGDYDVYAQKFDNDGSSQWTPNGTVICNETGEQQFVNIVDDGIGGAIISWIDSRSGNNDLYIQRVNSEGISQLAANGTAVCNESHNQQDLRMIKADIDSIIIAWQDWRIDRDIYAQRIEFSQEPEEPEYNFAPNANHPEDILTSTSGTETINWILTDDTGTGQYRVLVNDTSNSYRAWVDWTSWTNNTNLLVPINRTELGLFNYSIEYFDDQGMFGVVDTVLVYVYSNTQSNNIFGFDVLITIGITMISLLSVALFLKKRQNIS